jgi:hypothetical protein
MVAEEASYWQIVVTSGVAEVAELGVELDARASWNGCGDDVGRIEHTGGIIWRAKDLWGY